MTRTVVVPPPPFAPPSPDPSPEQPQATTEHARPGAALAVHQLVVDTAVLAVPGAAWVSITEQVGDSFHTTVASDDFARSIDQLQYDAGQGPCVSAASAVASEVYSVDLARDLRWPTFGTLAARSGVGSIVSFAMVDRQRTIGALNVCGPNTHAFTDSGQQVGRMLAAQAAHTLWAIGKQDNLEIALASRDVIGQAKGILMHQHRITSDQAFRLLVQTSTTTNRKLRDIAEHLTATGELPGRQPLHTPV